MRDIENSPKFITYVNLFCSLSWSKYTVVGQSHESTGNEKVVKYDNCIIANCLSKHTGQHFHKYQVSFLRATVKAIIELDNQKLNTH